MPDTLDLAPDPKDDAPQITLGVVVFIAPVAPRVVQVVEALEQLLLPLRRLFIDGLQNSLAELVDKGSSNGSHAQPPQDRAADQCDGAAGFEYLFLPLLALSTCFPCGSPLAHNSMDVGQVSNVPVIFFVACTVLLKPALNPRLLSLQLGVAKGHKV